jgi:hypothetical protein
MAWWVRPRGLSVARTAGAAVHLRREQQAALQPLCRHVCRFFFFFFFFFFFLWWGFECRAKKKKKKKKTMTKTI